LATKGTPIIRVTLDKERKKYIYERRKKEGKKERKKQKKEPVGQKKKMENEKKNEKREKKNIQNIKRAIWPNYIEHSRKTSTACVPYGVVKPLNNNNRYDCKLCYEGIL